MGKVSDWLIGMEEDARGCPEIRGREARCVESASL